MDVYLPRTLDEALAVKAEHPDAMPIAGGTDVMVELNFDRHRPEAIVDVVREDPGIHASEVLDAASKFDVSKGSE